MARFGRAQPKAPIFLRAPLVVFVASTALAPQIHVVQAEPHRPPATHVYVLRAPLAPPPTDQIHVVSLAQMRIWQHPARDADVIYVRPPISSVVPDRLTPQSHVVSLVDARTPSRGRHASVVQTRNALVPPSLANNNAPQIHVVQQNRRERISPPVHVTIVRNPMVPPALANTNAPQIHVVGQTWRTFHPSRMADWQIVRPPVSSVVPDRLAPQSHVVLWHPRRPLPPARIALERNPAVTVPDSLAPQIHVTQANPRAVRHPDRLSHITLERNPMVPPLLPLVRAEAVHHSTGAIPSPVHTTGAIPSPHQSTGTAQRFAGDSITRTYTMALDDPEQTISTSRLDCSESPGMG